MNKWSRHTVERPFHLSIGAVLVNDKNEVACHHFHERTDVSDGKHYPDIYILMRETPEPNESIETVVARGLKEEFGAEGELVGFLGSIVSTFPLKGVAIEKTTPYFFVRLTKQDISLREKDSSESVSTLEWLPIPVLIEHMKTQQQFISGRTDWDERPILERVQKYYI